MDSRPSKRDRLRAQVNHVKPQPLPCASRQSKVQLARTTRLAEDRLAFRKPPPVSVISGALDLHRLEERAGRGLQRDAIKRLGQAGLKGEDGDVAAHRD